MENQEILRGLQAALKSIGVSDLGESTLVPGQFDRFIRAAQRRTNVISLARFMPMMSPQENIDLIGFGGRVLTKGIKSDGNTVGTEATVKPDTKTNKLNAVELRGKTAINDRALRRNIERGTLENTLVDLFGEAAGRDLEEIGLLGDKSLSAPNILGVTDGWLEKADNKIETVNTSHKDWPENLFEKVLLELPKQYYDSPDQMKLFVQWEIANAYHNVLRKRGTPLGDTAQVGRPRLAYKGIEIIVAPMIERTNEFRVAALFANPANMVWGVFHEVTIEPKRDPENRRTEFYITVEADVQYEDERGAVAVVVPDES